MKQRISFVPAILAIGLLIGASVVAQQTPSAPADVPAETHQASEACIACHSPEAESGPAIDLNRLEHSTHRTLTCKDCHSSITDAPHTEAMLKEKPACANCHTEEAEAYAKSVHARPDKVAGDHPKCQTCHGQNNIHAIKPLKEWKRAEWIANCKNCHANQERMARYGPNTNAVTSYEHSFHGRALLRLNSQETAICTDCHSAHETRQPRDPLAPTAPGNLEKTCGKCHPGATQNFAISGSGHMDLTISRQPLLSGTLLFFRVLITVMMSFLLLGVVLDLYRALFGERKPHGGILTGVVYAIGFVSLIGAILLATFARPGAWTATLIGVGAILLSLILHKLNGNGKEHGPTIDRLSTSLRIQHTLTALCFIVLVATGMPIRNPDDNVLRGFYLAIGGLHVGRTIHHAAGALLIALFVYHVLELIVKWAKTGFRLGSLTMLPTGKDVRDFIQLSKFYLGISNEHPKFGRFSFRDKMGYLAEYWGVAVMGISGLILWFPVAIGGKLPREAISMSFIAHSYEAVLAFVAIFMWHFYNSIFNPNTLIISSPWRIGILTEEQMAHEHPLELEEMRRSGNVSADSGTNGPEPQTNL